MEDAFKIEIDHYVRVNFNTVIRVIDAIGGIEIELTKAEADYLNEFNETVTNMASTPTQKPCVEGVNHLDGGMACHYARLRGVDDDWHRMERQRKCILAVVNQLKGSSFSELNELCDIVLPLIQTNLTKLEIAELILYSPNFLKSEFDQMTIPIPNSYGGISCFSGVSGWALDYNKNNAALHEFLFGADSVQ
jgi:anionic cell wall polymer biosynthesis LytR-Cps2A-Psr (LCP) family protein